jgi:hypothetical protein
VLFFFPKLKYKWINAKKFSTYLVSAHLKISKSICTKDFGQGYRKTVMSMKNHSGNWGTVTYVFRKKSEVMTLTECQEWCQSMEKATHTYTHTHTHTHTHTLTFQEAGHLPLESVCPHSLWTVHLRPPLTTQQGGCLSPGYLIPVEGSSERTQLSLYRTPDYKLSFFTQSWEDYFYK